MADAPFQPDPRFETMLQLLDRAMKGDKEILGQIQRRGGFTKEELAPIQEYATRKWAAKGGQHRDVSGKDIADMAAVGASQDEILDYQMKVNKPVDIGAQYGMFLREENKNAPLPVPPSAAKAPAAKKPAGGGAKPKAKPKTGSKLDDVQAINPDQETAAAALKMLENIALPNTVLDSYGHPIDSPAQQTGPLDDMEEMHRRIAEGYKQREYLKGQQKQAK
jgi:hypothetical protein